MSRSINCKTTGENYACVYFFSSGLVLSSTNLYFNSTLYAKNTSNAIMINSIMFEIRSPYLNSEGVPYIPVTVADMLLRLPGKNRPIVGSIISLTNDDTTFETAWPITKAIANPIIPKVIRNAIYCSLNDFFSGGGCSVKVTILPHLEHITTSVE